MADYPYTSNPGKVKEFLKKIQTVGVPEKVTFKYLESLGYKSKNDRAILTVLKDIGFVDSTGTPTKYWKDFRSTSKAKAAMAAALRTTYSKLFSTYPNAHQTDNEALRNFFSSHTNVGDASLRYMVSMFKTLCELADFGADVPEEGDTEDQETDREDTKQRVIKKGAGAGGMTVNINIQLTLPAADNAVVYENLFAAMKKYLFSE